MSKLFISADIDTVLRTHIEQLFPQFSIKEIDKLHNKTKELFVFIYFRHNKHVLLKDERESYYANIYYKDLKKYDIMISGIRICYTDMIKILKELYFISVWEHSSNFQNNSFTYGYRPMYNNILPKGDDNVTFVNIPLDIFVIKDKKTKAQYKKESKSDAVDYLIDQTSKCRIDMNDLSKYIKKNWGMNYKEIQKLEYDKKTGICEEKFVWKVLDFKIANQLIIEAMLFNNKQFYFSQADTKRVYYSVASLNNLLLHSLRFGNYKKLMETDAKNCQPGLFTKFCKDITFVEACATGKFYDNMININDIRIDTRQKVKDECFNIFYDNKKLSTFLRGMLSIYGDLAVMIDEYKFKKIRIENPNFKDDGTNKKYSDKKNPKFLDLQTKGLETKGCNEYLLNENYNKNNKKYNIISNPDLRCQELWFLMQSLEADIFITKALAIFKHKGLDVLTRHDSILHDESIKEDVDAVLQYLYNEEKLRVTLDKKQLY